MKGSNPFKPETIPLRDYEAACREHCYKDVSLFLAIEVTAQSE